MQEPEAYEKMRQKIMNEMRENFSEVLKLKLVIPTNEYADED